MLEVQNIEYKSLWRNEFLRKICGFAYLDDSKAAGLPAPIFVFEASGRGAASNNNIE
jgi:hypothetical protein